MPPQADEDPRALRVIASGSHIHDPQAGSRSQIRALSIEAYGLFFLGILSRERLRCESCWNHSNRSSRLSHLTSFSGWNREGNGTPLQYSCLENPMDGGACWAAVHGVAKSRTQLSNFTFTFMHWRRKWQPTAVFLPGEFQERGAWWAAVYGVTQSRTRLKWLSSSSSSSGWKLFFPSVGEYAEAWRGEDIYPASNSLWWRQHGTWVSLTKLTLLTSNM